MIFLSIENLSKEYPANKIGIDNYDSATKALRGVTFQINSQETLALVGESGSGKTTLARCILRFIPADRGRIVYQGRDILKLSHRDFRNVQPKFQMIFQNPALALNPRQNVGEVIGEPLKIIKGLNNSVLKERTHELLDLVGLEKDLISRYPHQLSGGQQQKLVIARALALEPEFIMADEPTSSIDAIYKKQIIRLLQKLKEELGLTLLLITHDLDLVAEISDRVAVLYRGTLVEIGSADLIIKSPVHPYTRSLVEFSHYNQDLNTYSFRNYHNSSVYENTGCIFKEECAFSKQECQFIHPDQHSVSEDHSVTCHFAFHFKFDESKIFTGTD